MMKKVAIIGGGAAGMTAAILLAKSGHTPVLLERGERLGRKLSATGNGQGNVTNVHVGMSHYFTDDRKKAEQVLARFGYEDAVRFLEGLGGVFLPDARGRVYPASRQASAVTDLMRFELERLGTEVCLGAQVSSLTYDGQFLLTWAGGQMRADAVLLAAGGCAAPNFGTDGNGYALAKRFGHTVTELAPALVQLRCDPALVRGLKGIRVDAALTVLRGKEELFSGRGDVLFTESGVSGDLIFRASSFARAGDVLHIDLLPDVSPQKLAAAYARGGLLCVVNNGLSRALERRAAGKGALALVKDFALPVTGSLGFSYAQVTKGGVPLGEVDEHLMSTRRRGLFFAGEILNVDGECGGYNLHWAFASAHAAAEGICCLL